MYNKVILIGTVIQNQSDVQAQTCYVTVETSSENGKKTQHAVIAVKRMFKVVGDIAIPGELVRVEGMLSYNKDGAVVFAHNLAAMKVD